MISIYFTRHAKTRWNEEGRLQGQPDPETNLSDVGCCEAWALATAIVRAGIQPECIYSSTQPRAEQTRDIIASALPVRPSVKSDTRLKEISFGKWEGFTRTDIEGQILLPGRIPGPELRRRYQSIDPIYDDIRHPCGESKREAWDRSRPAFEEIVANTNTCSIAVLHKGIARLAMAHWAPNQAHDLTLSHGQVLRAEFEKFQKGVPLRLIKIERLQL